MASREKKLSAARKQQEEEPTLTSEPKNESTPESITAESEPEKVQNRLTNRKRVVGRKKKPTIAIKLKPKIKKAIKPKLIKTMLNNAKTVSGGESKKLQLLKTTRKARLLKPEPEPAEDETETKTTKRKQGRPAFKSIDKTLKAETPEVKTKRVYRRKIKIEPSIANESLDDVMNDLNSLIKTEEPCDGNKTPKKTLKKRKKDNIENQLCKLTPAERKVIDMLDLGVRKFQMPTQRRHSIEKFQISTSESLFSNLPRCISPRSKVPRLRQSVDAIRRSSPYKTRSDSPVRILRNGKTRKLKDSELLKGLNAGRRRRKLSGSEASKGYESDSSYSDLSSVHGGGDNGEVKEESKENCEFDEIGKVKRSLSADQANYTDTNSNFCVDKRKFKEEMIDCNNGVASEKVPDKMLILDSMKQVFNEEVKVAETQVKSEVLPPTLEQLVEPVVEPAVEPPIVEKVEEVQENGTGSMSELKVDETPVANGSNEGIVDEPEENLIQKESILTALGLQTVQAAKEAQLQRKEKPLADLRPDFYTGTLKTVIKINRGDRKKGRGMKMTLHKNRKNEFDGNGLEDGYKILKDGPSTSFKQGGQSSDTAGAHRKTHYSNRSNMDGSSEHTSDGEPAVPEGQAKALVIPEKASSFSIHPGRLCKDECSYCFGKFGLFDTPCHIAQMKSADRQNKILSTEKHLTTDSCLCDACYRHVDRKANTPSYSNKTFKRNCVPLAPGPRQDHCHVLGCGKVAVNILRRKWIIKMRKSVTDLINIDLDNPGLHSIPICDEHYSTLEHLMVCAMCKRRLAKNHVHHLGPEMSHLNQALQADGIPLTLCDKPVVCKLCKCFAAIVLNRPENRPEASESFLRDYKKRLLHFNDIVPMDEAAAEEPITIPNKEQQVLPAAAAGRVKKRKLKESFEYETKSDSRPESPSDYMVDYNTLIPTIAMECGSSDSESKCKEPIKIIRKVAKQAEPITKRLKTDKSSDIAVARLGSNPSISVRQLFPCEEDLPLQGAIEFGTVKERTPEGWEKCTSTIQYDNETKHLWHELQKPYGNQSSFLRHLILLEKYFRNGDLTLAPNASHHSLIYHESVQNRLKAYDNIPHASNTQPLTMVQFNKPQKSSSGIITSMPKATPATEPQPMINAANIPKNTPITISQLNSPPLLQAAAIPPQTTIIPLQKAKPVGAPPGLISLQPGTNKPVAPLVKPVQPPAVGGVLQQSQKIKFPITKNWRPNLIPIDVSRKSTTERKAGLVQVISGGKPYHITVEDYKKMCAIKKSFELKQKRIMEMNKGKEGKSLLKSSNAIVSPKKVSPSGNNGKATNGSVVKEVEGERTEVEKRFSGVGGEKGVMSLPKIPKSLTVIPQTVARRPSRPSSPILMITSKPKQPVKL